MTVPDSIRKSITLRAPLARVWRAVSDAHEFGAWFGVELDGPFVAGERLTGKIRPTQVDAAVAKGQEPYTGKPFEITVDRIEPPFLFSFRWRPFAVETGVDYGSEPSTLVTFELTEIEGGVQLVITESGFDKVPLERRARAFTMNEGGWEAQTRLVKKYVEEHAP